MNTIERLAQELKELKTLRKLEKLKNTQVDKKLIEKVVKEFEGGEENE